jgi:hypothetical protein
LFAAEADAFLLQSRETGENCMRILASIGALAVVAAVAAAIYFFGGFYSVAATTPDSGIVAWALGHVRAASIKQHATGTAPFALDDQSVIQAGLVRLPRAAA